MNRGKISGHIRTASVCRPGAGDSAAALAVRADRQGARRLARGRGGGRRVQAGERAGRGADGEVVFRDFAGTSTIPVLRRVAQALSHGNGPISVVK